MLQELRQHLSFQEAARRCHVSTSQVIRVFNEVHIPRPSHLPRVLSIDECKGNAAGQKYQVIITDSENKRIMDILPARTTPALLQYFYQFPMSEQRKVEFVTMDMSMQFRSVIKTIFPKARIVEDRFHMIGLVQALKIRHKKNTSLPKASEVSIQPATSYPPGPFPVEYFRRLSLTAVFGMGTGGTP